MEQPKRVRTCRDRLRQKEWFPMPWDGTRRTVVFETVAADHWMFQEKYKKHIEAKRRKIDEYRVYYYGTPEQLNNRKLQLRSALKFQLDRNEQSKQHYVSLTKEGETMARQVEESVRKEKEEARRKREFLRKNIRDGNKTLIEMKAAQRKLDLQQIKSAEKEMLKHNPINWNKTLH